MVICSVGEIVMKPRHCVASTGVQITATELEVVRCKILFIRTSFV